MTRFFIDTRGQIRYTVKDWKDDIPVIKEAKNGIRRNYHCKCCKRIK